jgi:hypothetical protein
VRYEDTYPGRRPGDRAPAALMARRPAISAARFRAAGVMKAHFIGIIRGLVKCSDISLNDTTATGDAPAVKTSVYRRHKFLL